MLKLSGAAAALCTLLVANVALADWPANVTKVAAEKGKTTTANGKLEAGAEIADLAWAASSSNACFPATQNERFRGNHVLYSTSLPPRSKMYITVTPKDPSVDMSIYAYTIGTTNFYVPPSLPKCVSCEAEYKWDRPKKGKTQDHTRTVMLNAIGNPYNVLIGVAGAKGIKAGDYTLSIKVE